MNNRSVVIFVKTAFFLAIVLSFAVIPSPGVSRAAVENDTPHYVGSRSCEPCHREEYTSFIRYAKKSNSYQSIERLEKGLSPDDLKRCFGCHTTGYGRPGGFISIEETPELRNAGCEVCHGPGGEHVQTTDPGAIKRQLSRADCEVCHISERVRAFRYKPLIHGGGH